MGWGGELFRAVEFFSVVVLTDAWLHSTKHGKHPKKPLVRSWESAEDRVDGGGGGDGAPHTLIMEARKGVVLLSHLFLLP